MILTSEKRRELLARLAAGPSTQEALAASLSWASSAVAAALRALELAGDVERVAPLPPFAPRHPLQARRSVPRWKLVGS